MLGEVGFERRVFVGVENFFPRLDEARRAGTECVAVLVKQRVNAIAHVVFVAGRVVADCEEAGVFDDCEELLLRHVPAPAWW